ncbi:hypothetical protein V6N13_014523 [Hibiscus sabdariffa]
MRFFNGSLTPAYLAQDRTYLGKVEIMSTLVAWVVKVSVESLDVPPFSPFFRPSFWFLVPLVACCCCRCRGGGLFGVSFPFVFSWRWRFTQARSPS